MILVVGNGESRKDVNINNIPMKKIGCNAIYRDYYVDHLVCVDKRMCQEAINAGFQQNSKIYTRYDLLFMGHIVVFVFLGGGGGGKPEADCGTQP